MLLEENNYAKTKILNAIMDDPEIITLFKEKYVDDEIWKFCIEREPSLFKKMRHPSEQVCMFACEIDGSNLKYVKNKFSYITITNVMVLTAVKSNPKAILYVPKKFMTYELVESAFDRDPSLMKEFKNIRIEYLKKIMSERPDSIRYINPKHFHDAEFEDIICNTIITNPGICVYINNMTDKMLITLEEYHPNYFNLYRNGNSIS